MKNVKALNMLYSALMILAVLMLSLGFTACSCDSTPNKNVEKCTVSTKEVCDEIEGDYADINVSLVNYIESEGAQENKSSYEKGTNLHLSCTNVKQGYYFVEWKIGNNSYTSTTYNFELNENTTVTAVFGKGARTTVGRYSVIAKNGVITISNNTIHIDLDESITTEEFSYWKTEDGFYSVKSSLSIDKDDITSNITLEPVCANCGVFTIVYEFDGQDPNYFETNLAKKYSTFKTQVADIDAKYAFVKDPYNGKENYIQAEYITHNMQLNSVGEIYNLTTTVTKSYLVKYWGVMFFDKNNDTGLDEGECVCVISSKTIYNPVPSTVSGSVTVKLANNSAGVQPNFDTVKIELTVNKASQE